ncbi:MAG TPA: eL32 family ribosomal protein [Methanomassiliicoccales archaeon]|nr:eL32 family ribosomal protein [Methanomassiliicoccales archaeon]
MVHTVGQLDDVNPKVQAIRIGGTVGGRKRAAITERADELGIRVLNRT